MDERAQAAGTSATGAESRAGAEMEKVREECLRRLLERVESGRLPVPEYTERVRQLERATSVADMVEIAEDAAHPGPGLDPVDMLLLARSTKAAGPPAGASRPRYFLIGVLLFFFVVLLVVGLWLVSHARALHNSGGVGVVPAAASSYDAGPASPPSLRSSRR